MTKRVAVLMGGRSAEREVSLVSGDAVTKALQKRGYDAQAIDVGPVGDLVGRLDPKPDVVFNALHGQYGEDGCVQGVLNMLEIPYTHSGLLASALAMNKPMAKVLFAKAGITVAEEKLVNRADVLAGDVMPRPYVVKPLNQGSSVGVHIMRQGDNDRPFMRNGWPFGDRVMVERFIPGRELTVAVMGDAALAVTEISTQRGFYDYDAKYAPGGSRHVVPAEINKSVYDEALRISRLAHQTLGCRGVSRADIRYDGKLLYLLEINTQPGMTPTSLVPEQAAHVGMSFEDLVAWMVEHAECDT